jgi:uncharacterized protein YjeT (DUF2065 family)
MPRNELAGIVLILFGLFDFFVAPKLLQSIWQKAKVRPPWADWADRIIRVAGILFIFFGVSFYYFGRLD